MNANLREGKARREKEWNHEWTLINTNELKVKKLKLK